MPDALLDGLLDDRVRRHLDEQPVPLGEQPRGALREAHGLAELAGPVGGVEALPAQRLAGHGGDDGHTGRPGCDAREQLGQLLLEERHLRAMHRGAGVHRPHEDVAAREGAAQIAERRGLAREDGRRRAGGDGAGDAPRERRRERLRLFPADRREEHRPHPHPALDEPRLGGDHPRGVLQRERARHVRRGHLADAVPDHRRRRGAVRAQEPRERHLEREQRRPRDVDALGHGPGRAAEDLVEDRPAEEGAEGAITAIERGAERRLPEHQRAPHAGPLRSLAREDPRHATGLGGGRGDRLHGARHALEQDVAVRPAVPERAHPRAPRGAVPGRPGAEGLHHLEPQPRGNRCADWSRPSASWAGSGGPASSPARP